MVARQQGKHLRTVQVLAAAPFVARDGLIGLVGDDLVVIDKIALGHHANGAKGRVLGVVETIVEHGHAHPSTRKTLVV